MGPSSLSLKISLEAPGISLPNITGSQASFIKLTLNGLIGSLHVIVRVYVFVHVRKKQEESKTSCTTT